MSLSVGGARTSLLPSSFTASSSRPRFLALPLHRRSHGSLTSLPAACRRRLRVRMARTESTGVTIGFRAPDFELPEPLTGKLWTLDDFEGNSALLVMFICNHCPFVKHLKKDISKLASFYVEKGLGAVAISSNSVRTHPQDGPDRMAEEAELFKYPFPYLYDEVWPHRALDSEIFQRP
ncbi:Thioredoxin superfamily protein [Zea mays]|uniref:Thioredoxin superfamily protein n=1 Tax=Zea mays TaxID=4577 RepID=B4FMV4_MAIZE|nr:unknown [Zea mays]ONM21282.1 Thioredoxin superfamily protein [Zea mays]|eukprot:NP_001140258.1 thiol-disulfide isomerase and thioredoxins [Zea mays]